MRVWKCIVECGFFFVTFFVYLPTSHMCISRCDFFFEVFFPDSTSVYSLVKPASVLSV